MSADTPRERIAAFLEEVHPDAKYAAVIDPARPLLVADIRAVLNANAGYERIITKERREAVEEYKKTLAAQLRRDAVEAGKSKDADLEGTLEGLAGDLEDGTL